MTPSTHFRKNAKTNWLGARMLLLLALSLLFMSVDHKSQYFSKLHQSLSVILLPIQYTVDRPVGFLKSIEDNLINRQYLLDEKKALKQNQLLLSARLHRLLALGQENRHLKEFSGFCKNP